MATAVCSPTEVELARASSAEEIISLFEDWCVKGSLNLDDEADRFGLAFAVNLEINESLEALAPAQLIVELLRRLYTDSDGARSS